MTSTNNDDVKFDYKSLRQRISIYRSNNERAKKLKFTREYIERCARRFRKARAEAPKNPVGIIFKSVVDSAQSESTRAAVAGLCLAGFGIWIGNALYVQYAAQRERAIAQKCSENNFSHSINGVCYDEHRRIHTLNPDGTATKGVMDRKVWRETDFAEKVANPKKAD